MELKTRAQKVNDSIVALAAKKQVAQARVVEIVKELGVENADTLTLTEIHETIQQLAAEDNARLEKLAEEIKSAEAALAAVHA